jgi:hypothetical protein
VCIRLTLARLGQVEEEIAALVEHALDAPPRLRLVGRTRIRAGEQRQEDDVRARQGRADEVHRARAHTTRVPDERPRPCAIFVPEV